MKTESVGISTSVEGKPYPGPGADDKLTLEYELPESVDEFIKTVGETGRGSTYDLTSSEYRTRFSNTARAKYRELLKAGVPPEEAADQIRELFAGWNSTVSIGGKVDGTTAIQRDLAGKSAEEQIAYLKEMQAKLQEKMKAIKG